MPRRGLVAAFLALAVSAAAAPAAEPAKREVVPGVWVTISTDFDMDYAGCLPDDAPEIVVSKPPAKGETLVGLALTRIDDGTCKGTMVDARILLYKANEATSGDDRFEYRLKHANGKSEDRKTVVRIRDQR
jgi:hypothetical protein